ncbi:MAG: glycosyltransferase family 2 protein [Dysgonamonadaceae bacterium]|nr:glycosyltransferase family 2 protein [Dysgonamonadaceae bacterium]MDD3356673.1 glycosyltransferase family 2 protein [Dysgonamonadaceae bacterium]MDD3726823.1 glycosyltransferase family 2 protein [Dysgonamonadaceae bacterium]
MKNKKVCVIIVSYNFEPWIDKCLPAVFASTIPSTVLVIDNNSNDKTVERVQKDFPQVILIENKDNLGFGKANNIGFKYALDKGFDYIFLLNQDTWIEKDMLEKLIIASETNSEFGIISPVHLSSDGTSLDHGFANYSNKKTLDEIVQISPLLVELPFVNAAFWLLPIAVVKKIGGFSPLFYHYGEDRNYIQRTHFHNFKIGYLPNAFATHDRQNRKVTNKEFLYAEYVYFLSELANINYSFSKAIAYSVLAAIKKMFIEGFGGRFSNSGAYLKMAFKLLGKVPMANATRKKTKVARANYLTTQTTKQ